LERIAAWEQDPTDWHTLMTVLKKNFPAEAGSNPTSFLSGIILATNGIPGTLMPFIQNFPSETLHG
jgi:hypothetical protein